MYTEYEEFKAGEELLNFLVSEGLVEEDLKRQIVSEQKLTKFEGIILNEAGASDLGTNYLKIYGTHVSWEEYLRVYTNPDAYPTPDMVMKAIGIDVDTFFDVTHPDMSAGERRSRMGKELAEANKKWKQKRMPNSEELVTPKKREMAYSQRFANDRDNETFEQEPTVNDIDRGSRQRSSGPSTNIINKINDNADIFAGEFYNDISRIPPSRWNIWLKFWKREKTRLPKDKSWFGREWKKHFIFGYKMDEKNILEVWYNTIDSKFSIHDKNGSEISKRSETMNETMGNMLRFLVQMSPNDRDVFLNSNSGIAKSMARSMVQGLEGDQRMKDMMAKERKELSKAEKLERAKSIKNSRAQRTSRDDARETRRRGRGVDADDQWRRDSQVPPKASERSRPNRDFGHNDPDGAWAGQSSDQYHGSPDQQFGGVDDDKFDNANDVTPNFEYDPTVDDVNSDTNVQGGGFADTYHDAFRKENNRQSRETDLMKKWLDEENARIKKQKQTKKELDDWEGAGPKAPKALPGTKTKKDQEEANKKQSDLFRQAIDDYKKDNPYKGTKPRVHAKNKKNKKTNESEELDGIPLTEAEEARLDDLVDLLNSDIGKEINSPIYRNRITELRKKVTKDNPFTAKLIRSSVTDDTIKPYGETKIDSGGALSWVWNSIMSGRKGRIQVPNDFGAKAKALGNTLIGNRTSADFLIGFSLGEYVNFEVWYVTEPNPAYVSRWWDLFSTDVDEPRTITSYYVYDVSGKRVVRKNLPYYRNAVQEIMAKIVAF